MVTTNSPAASTSAAAGLPAGCPPSGRSTVLSSIASAAEPACLPPARDHNLGNLGLRLLLQHPKIGGALQAETLTQPCRWCHK